jgi:hypothetical protein
MKLIEIVTPENWHLHTMEDYVGEVQELVAERAALSAEVERLKAENTWIPVSERLPEEGSNILIWARAKADSGCDCFPSCIIIGKFSNGKFDDFGYFVTESFYVTHWRKLPEQP